MVGTIVFVDTRSWVLEPTCGFHQDAGRIGNQVIRLQQSLGAQFVHRPNKVLPTHLIQRIMKLNLPTMVLINRVMDGTAFHNSYGEGVK